MDCSDNQLTNLDLTSRLEQLTCLNTRNNSLSEKDLFLLLQHFNSLGKLWINERSKRYDLCLECNQHQRSQQQAQILQPTNPPFDNN